MLFNNILKICAGCRKRKLWVSRPWIKPKFLPMPAVKPQNAMCRKCLNNYKNLKPQHER